MALVTSLRDGMNLVSYEFVACQDLKKGVLILSEVSIISIILDVDYISIFCFLVLLSVLLLIL